MPRFVGTWEAHVQQDFEVEAPTEADAIKLVVKDEASPHNVVELLDIEVTSIEEEN